MRSQVQPSSKNFSKAEFQLVKESSARSVKSFTPARLHSRISKIEKLLKNYKTKMKAQRATRRSEVTGDKLEGRKLIDYRMEHLNKSLGSYRDQLKTVEASPEKGTKSVRKTAKATTRRATSSRPGAARTGRKASAAKKSSSTKQAAKSASTKRATPSKRSGATSSKPALRARKSTSERVDRNEDTQESKGMLPQHKMRLNRKGNGARFRESQRQQSLQETEVNPARRNV